MYKDPNELYQACGEDFLAAFGELVKTALPLNNYLEKEPPIQKSGGLKRGRPTAAQMMVQFVQKRARLLRNEMKTPYASLEISGRREILPIRGTMFKEWLNVVYFEETGKPPSKFSLEQAITTVAGLAALQGSTENIYLRVAREAARVLVDLNNDCGEVVEITPDGWQIITNPTVNFYRPSHSSTLPRPSQRKDLTLLRKYLNTSEEGFVLLSSFLMGTINGLRPFPILELRGEQGTAKSTTARLIQKLLDPSKIDIRAEPKDIRDLMIAAEGGYLLSYDNISYLHSWLSDALCRLSTGGGFGTRKLYTDSEEQLFSLARPVILNGIDDVINRGDLMDRALIIDLSPIPTDKRKEEKILWEEFEQDIPSILGALYDAVAIGLKHLNSVSLKVLPRMADFAKWIVACEPALPWQPGEFLRVYAENKDEAAVCLIESDDFTSAVRRLIADRKEWKGTARELKKAIDADVTIDDYIKQSRAWPKNPQNVSHKMKLAAPSFRSMGIDVIFRTSHGKKRVIVLTMSTKGETTVSALEEKTSQPFESKLTPVPNNEFGLDDLVEMTDIKIEPKATCPIGPGGGRKITAEELITVYGGKLIETKN